MRLDNFDLVEYNGYSDEHKYVISRINSRYLGDLNYAIQRINQRKVDDFSHNKFFIAYYNNRPIGYISITKKDFGYEVASGLLPEERGYHLGTLLLQEFSEEVFRVMPDVDQLVLVIDSSNERGKRAAISAGYMQKKGDNEKYEQRRR